MNNLTQTQRNAKQAFLDRQQAEMIVNYQIADQTERNAIIKHINSFLEVIPKDAKIFWLKFRQRLERISEQTA